MLQSDQAVGEVADILRADDFYRPAHEVIFSAIMHLYEGSNPVDAVTVAAELQKRGKIRIIGGQPYLLDLLSAIPTATGAAYYAKIVAGKARLRRVSEVGARLQQLGYTETASNDEVDALLAEAGAVLSDAQTPATKALSFDDLVAEWRLWQKEPSNAIPTPWFEINPLLNGGLQKGALHVVAADTGGGKSNAGLNMAVHAAELGHKTLALSLEMDTPEVTSRILASGGYANLGEIIRKQMQRDTLDRIDEYVDTNRGMPFSLIDESYLSVERVAAHCRSYQPEVVFLDYIQLLGATDPRLPRNQQVGHMSRSLKLLAKDSHIAIVVAAQLNRAPSLGGGKDNPQGRAPTIHDLAESSSIEKDADVIILMHRPPDDQGVVRFHIAKNRNGRLGKVELKFRGQIARVG